MNARGWGGGGGGGEEVGGCGGRRAAWSLIYGLEMESPFFLKVGDSWPHLGLAPSKICPVARVAKKVGFLQPARPHTVSPPARRSGCMVSWESVSPPPPELSCPLSCKEFTRQTLQEAGCLGWVGSLGQGFSTAGLLTRGTESLRVAGRPVPSRVVGSIPGLTPLEAVLSPLPPVVTTSQISRHCQMNPREKYHPGSNAWSCASHEPSRGCPLVPPQVDRRG